MLIFFTRSPLTSVPPSRRSRLPETHRALPRAASPCSRHATDDPRPGVPGAPRRACTAPEQANLPLVPTLPGHCRFQHVCGVARALCPQPAAPAAGRSASARRPAAVAPRDVRARVSQGDVEDAIASNPLFNKWVLLAVVQ